MPLDYGKAVAMALHRRQLRLNATADRYATAKSPLRYEPNAAHVAALARENHNTAIRLCPHGKVPRLIAEAMEMPWIGCQRCA